MMLEDSISLSPVLFQVWLDVVERASKFLRQVVCGEVSSSTPGPKEIPPDGLSCNRSTNVAGDEGEADLKANAIAALEAALDGDLLSGSQPDLGARRRGERYLLQFGDLDRVAGGVAVGQRDLEHPRRRVRLLVALWRRNVSNL